MASSSSNSKQDFDELWDYSKPAVTEKKFRALLPKAEKSKDKSYLIELLTQIARTQGLQRKFDEAHKTLDKAMKMIKSEHIRPRIRYMLERGRAYNSSNVFDKAREIFLAAYQQAVKYKEDNYAVDAAHMIGIVEKGEESLKWNDIAVKIAEQTSDEYARGWLGSLYNNIGWTYFSMKKYDKALELFEKYVEFQTKMKREKGTAIAKWCVAKTLRMLGKTEEALKKQLELKKWWESNKDLEPDGYIYEEIGECFLALNKQMESKEYFKQAYEVLSKDIWLEANEKERLERLKSLSG